MLEHSFQSERKVAISLIAYCSKMDSFEWVTLEATYAIFERAAPIHLLKIFKAPDFEWGLDEVSWALWNSITVIEMAISNRDSVYNNENI